MLWRLLLAFIMDILSSRWCPSALQMRHQFFRVAWTRFFNLISRNSYWFFLFYDILVYSKDWDAHLHQVTLTLKTLRENQLFKKKSKCTSRSSSIEYLEHIYIIVEGVSTYPTKSKAMVEWPTPRNLNELRSFLGLTWCNRRFVKNYRRIAQPRT